MPLPIGRSSVGSRPRSRSGPRPLPSAIRCRRSLYVSLAICLCPSILKRPIRKPADGGGWYDRGTCCGESAFYSAGNMVVLEYIPLRVCGCSTGAGGVLGSAHWSIKSCMSTRFESAGSSTL